MRIRNPFIFFILFVLMSMASCSPERKLAKTFVEQHDSISVLLIPPDFIFKTNLKIYSIGDAEGLSEEEQSLRLLDSSKFLKHVEDTILMGRYFSSLESQLRKFGIFIYTPEQMVEFMTLQHALAYQVSLAQLEVEEGIFEYRAQEAFDSTLYYEDFALDQLIMNYWFEVSKLNDPSAVNNVLFNSMYITDGLEGRFTSNVFTGEVKFKYNIYPLETEDLYTLAATAGEQHAYYLFDYIMNQYIYTNFPEGQQPNSFLHYDHDTKVFYPAGDDRFIFLDE